MTPPQADADPEVSLVVVTHESAGVVGACLSSIRAHPGRRSQEVILVDNSSSDGTADLVAAGFPEVRLVRSRVRRGFAANCNTGADRARGRVLVFLNPDARLSAGAVDGLVDHLGTDPRVGLAGARLVYPDGRHQPSARRFPTLGTTLIRRTPLRWLLPDTAGERRHLMADLDPDRLADPVPVDWVLGAAMALPAELYRRLGGMDEGFRLYCEDIDLCWRVWEAGLEVAYVPAAVIEHDLSELTRRRFLTRATLWHVGGMARFARLHGLGRPLHQV